MRAGDRPWLYPSKAHLHWWQGISPAKKGILLHLLHGHSQLGHLTKHSLGSILSIRASRNHLCTTRTPMWLPGEAGGKAQLCPAISRLAGAPPCSEHWSTACPAIRAHGGAVGCFHTQPAFQDQPLSPVAVHHAPHARDQTQHCVPTVAAAS